METARTLTDQLADLLRREHDALAEFLVALADYDKRRAWAELGYASLFTFLHRELRLSKGAAQYRKVAAELIQEVPAVIEPLRRGDLCLTSIIEAAKVVTRENCEVLLPRFFGLSKREAMEVVASLQPHPAPPVRTVVTPVRQATKASSTSAAVDLRQSPADLACSSAAGWPADLSLTAAPPPPAVASARPEVVPLSQDMSRLHITVSRQFTRKLAAARDARPGLTDEALLEAALDLLLAQVAKRRGLVEKPQQNPRPSKAAHVPAHVRREVWKRDGGCCSWRLASGEVCGSTFGLEFDHRRPLALGGTSDVANVRLLCRVHNQEAARRALGDALMNRYVGKKARERRGAARREVALLPGLDPPRGEPRAPSS